MPKLVGKMKTSKTQLFSPKQVQNICKGAPNQRNNDQFPPNTPPTGASPKERKRPEALSVIDKSAARAPPTRGLEKSCPPGPPKRCRIDIFP